MTTPPDHFRAWLERHGLDAKRERVMRMFHTRDVEELPSNLQNVAVMENHRLVSFHLTDDPQVTHEALASGKQAIDIPEGDWRWGRELGPGFYISNVPAFWIGRSRRKWEFLDRLEAAQLEGLTGWLLEHLDQQRDSYNISAHEHEYAVRQIEHVRRSAVPADHLVSLAGQPYNIRFWAPDVLARFGIQPGTAPSVLRVEAEGWFTVLDGLPQPNVLHALVEAGFDGALVTAGLMSNPEGVIWNPQAIKSLRVDSGVTGEVVGGPRHPKTKAARLRRYLHGYADARKMHPGLENKKGEQWKNAARIVRTIARGMQEMPKRPGLAPLDACMKNWGLTNGGHVVLRDLACGTADLMFDDAEQNEVVDVVEWPPPTLWDGVRVPATVKGPLPSGLLTGLDLTSVETFKASLRRVPPEQVAALDAAVKEANRQIMFPGPGWKTLWHGAPTKIADQIESHGFRLGPGRRSLGFLGADYEVENLAVFLSDTKELARYFGSNRSEHPMDYQVMECSADVSKVVAAEELPSPLNTLAHRLIQQDGASKASRISHDRMWWLMDQRPFVAGLKAAGYTGMSFPETREIRREAQSPDGRTWALLIPDAIRLRRRDTIHGLDRILGWLQGQAGLSISGPPPRPADLTITHPDIRSDPKTWGPAIEQARRERQIVADVLAQMLTERRALEVTDPRHSVVLVLMRQADGVIRVGRFDSRGPVGHQEIPPGPKQWLELAAELERTLASHPDKQTTTIRLVPPERSIVDFWMKQPLGRWGTQVLRIVQQSNELRAKGQYEEAHTYERAEMEKIGPQPEEVPLPDTVGGPLGDKQNTARDERLGNAAYARILTPWRDEAETGRGTITLEFPTFTEDWDWITFEGKQIGTANRAGRLLLDLPRNPAAGIAWFTENGQAKISSYWVEELLRRHGVLRKLLEVYRQIIFPTVIMVGPFSRAGRKAAEVLADKIEE